MMGESRNQYTLLFRCCVVLGLVLRCWHYFRNPSVWMDEAATLVNVINLDCTDLWTSPRKTDAQLRMFGRFELRWGDVPQR